MVTTMTNDIQSLLGEKAESLLGFDSPKIPKERLHLPGPDFVDRVFMQSDRNNRVLGNLDDVWIPVSNYQVRPFVGSLPGRPRLIPQMQEVAAVVELPVRRLLAADAIDEEEIEVRGFRLRAAVYRYGGERIWGATARTLAMFAQVAREAGRAS